MSVIYWQENPLFDEPKLNSPQPCVHGAGCAYTVKDPDGNSVPGICHYVHPGEEGRGRRLFFAHTIHLSEGTIKQPACVCLIGKASYYERIRLRIPWHIWCIRQGIPYTANKPGVQYEPVKRIRISAVHPMQYMGHGSKGKAENTAEDCNLVTPLIERFNEYSQKISI
jgi:hypothetical protein